MLFVTNVSRKNWENFPSFHSWLALKVGKLLYYNGRKLLDVQEGGRKKRTPVENGRKLFLKAENEYQNDRFEPTWPFFHSPLKVFFIFSLAPYCSLVAKCVTQIRRNKKKFATELSVGVEMRKCIAF